MRDTVYNFVETDSDKVVSRLVTEYESKTGRTVNPADPERLFISWLASIINQERINKNFAGNQNIPSSAERNYLDALGKWIFGLERKGAQYARCSVKFTISEAQATAIAVPKGTRVSSTTQQLIWETTEDALVEIGEISVEVPIRCQTAGTIGNGFVPGQINTLIDVDNVLYYTSCENVMISDGGAEQQSDEEYFQSLREFTGSYSTAGARNSYIYHAKSVSSEIADVKVVSPDFGITKQVPVYTDSSGKKFVFAGGDQIDIASLGVYPNSGPVSPETDYMIDYTDGLLKVEFISPIEDKYVYLDYRKAGAGLVYIYALMNDGTIATDTIKEAIFEACNPDDVRPLTDSISVEDPEEVPYDIEFTYYVPKNTQLSLSDIEMAVKNAVEEYTKWQYAKLGRDINPDKLKWLLMEAGIKRTDISSPQFLSLNSGADRGVPQIAKLGNVTIKNGGFEDE